MLSIMIKKNLLILGLSAMMIFGAAGCGNQEETTTQATTVETASTTSASATTATKDLKEYTINVTETPMLCHGNLMDIEITKDGKIRSDLTGEWIDRDLAKRKPVACMINNLSVAMPQSGVGRADVIYEMLEEGGITRLMCIFTEYDDMDQIGPVRSTRAYYVRKAVEHQAFLVHWGRADNALADLHGYPGVEHANFNNDDIYEPYNEPYVEGGYRLSRPGKAIEHTAYVSGKAINDFRATQPFQLEKNENYEKMFYFNKEDTEPTGGKDANVITTELSAYTQPWFEYDPETKLYNRFQYGGPHIDELTGEQLAFKNVIVLFATHSLCIPERQNLERDAIDIELLGKGEGFYASDGKIIPITWEKETIYDVTHYYTEDGEMLKLNPGKTFISYMKDDNKEALVVE